VLVGPRQFLGVVDIAHLVLPEVALPFVCIGRLQLGGSWGGQVVLHGGGGVGSVASMCPI